MRNVLTGRSLRSGKSFARRTLQLFSLLALAFFSGSASAQTGYTTVFGGGPLYKHVPSNITEIENSGFTEVVVRNIAVSSAGDLNFNGEFPLTSNGTYNRTPNLPQVWAITYLADRVLG
jgi:hypothetical protein